jgi:hypothetical protein
MGSLSNLYISQSYQSLIHLANNNTASATSTELQDGLGNGIGIYVNTNGEISASSFSGSVNGIGNVSSFSSSVNSRIIAAENTGYVTTASFNSYTASTNSKITAIESFTASVSTSVGLLQTFSSSQYKTDSSSFDSRLDSEEFKSTTFVGTASFNSYTASTNSEITAIESFTASVSTSVGLLQTFSSSQYKNDSSSFDSRILAITSSGGGVSVGTFNTYTASQDFKNTTFATTSSVTALSQSLYFTDTTQSNNISSISTSVGLLQTFSASSDSRYVQNSQTSSMAVSSSLYAVTASYAVNGGVTQLLAGPNITISPLSGKGQVTISSTGTGSGSFNTATGSYGSFYDTTTQPNPVANILQIQCFNETAITNGVSISG